MPQYPSLSSPVKIKYPFRCRAKTPITIEDLHPADPKFNIASRFRNKPAILAYTSENNLYRRQESYSTNNHRKSWVACNIEIDGVIMRFEAVRFRRRGPLPNSTFYKMVKEGRI